MGRPYAFELDRLKDTVEFACGADVQPLAALLADLSFAQSDICRLWRILHRGFIRCCAARTAYRSAGESFDTVGGLESAYHNEYRCGANKCARV